MEIITQYFEYFSKMVNDLGEKVFFLDTDHKLFD